ncbi:MAG TPA: VTT domain-containing protein [Blastocatellia bacterium]|nr:VTT domain-containing protein [Blastocatellia bacterium]
MDWLKSWFLEISHQVVIAPMYFAAPLMVLVGALDSSLLSLPEVNDYITITRVAHNPAEVYYFPLFPAIGSVIGCLLLYRIARSGEQFISKRFHPKHLDRVQALYRKWGLFALVIPALLPPPMPFKIFVAMAGALNYPPMKFALTILIARTMRYYFWGILAYFYREEVKMMLGWLQEHFFASLGIIAGAMVLIVLLRLLLAKQKSPSPETQASYTD